MAATVDGQIYSHFCMACANGGSTPNGLALTGLQPVGSCRQLRVGVPKRLLAHYCAYPPVFFANWLLIAATIFVRSSSLAFFSASAPCTSMPPTLGVRMR